MSKHRKLWKYKAGRRPFTVTVEEFEPGANLYVRIWIKQEKRYRYRSLRHRDRGRARDYAERLATKLREGRDQVLRTEPTVERVFRLYRRFRTPQKAPETQDGDERRMELYVRFLGASKKLHAISFEELDRLAHIRKTGAIDPRGSPVAAEKRKPVSLRTLEAELRWLKAVCTWAMNWKTQDGQYLLRENPLRGFRFPKERNPTRTIATHDRFEKIRAVSDEIETETTWAGEPQTVRSYLSELLDLANGTGRRISAICQLRYEDVRLSEGLHGAIRWPADTDKMGSESTVPIGPAVRAAIDRILQERPGIGKAFLFPAPKDPSKSLRYELASHWLMEAEKLAGVPKQDRALWHAYRRKWATERKHLPDVDVAAAGGWLNPRTLAEIYQQPDADTMLRVVLEGGQLRGQQG